MPRHDEPPECEREAKGFALCAASQAQHPPPQQPPAEGADPTPAPAAADPTTPTADHTRTTSSCPCGQRTCDASSVTERLNSKVSSHSRQR